MQRHKNVKCTDPERLKSVWTGDVRVNENYHDYKDEFLDMLSEIKERWADTSPDLTGKTPNRSYIARSYTNTISNLPYLTACPRIRRRWNGQNVKNSLNRSWPSRLGSADLNRHQNGCNFVLSRQIPRRKMELHVSASIIGNSMPLPSGIFIVSQAWTNVSTHLEMLVYLMLDLY